MSGADRGVKVKIIGVGSAQDGDRAGWQLIEALQQAGFEAAFQPGSVELQICRFPAQLLTLLADCRSAVILDAVRQPCGTLTEYSEHDLRLSQRLHSSHGIGVGEALALAERLLPAPVPVRILGIGVGEAADPDPGAIAALLPELSDRLNAVVRGCCTTAVVSNQQTDEFS